MAIKLVSRAEFFQSSMRCSMLTTHVMFDMHTVFMDKTTGIEYTSDTLKGQGTDVLIECTDGTLNLKWDGTKWNKVNSEENDQRK